MTTDFHQTQEKRHVLDNPEAACAFLKPLFDAVEGKAFFFVLMDAQYGVIEARELKHRGPDEPPDDLVKVLLGGEPKLAIVAHRLAAESNDSDPTNATFTHFIEHVLGKAGVRLVDHIVLGAEGYRSFAREGLIGV